MLCVCLLDFSVFICIKPSVMDSAWVKR